METIDVKVKKWGNSLGVVIPKEIINSKNLKEGSEIELIIRPLKKTKVKNVFGILKGKMKKSSDQILKEVDKELWGIEK